MSNTSLDRIIRKEVSLGAIRERPFPEGHIGLTQVAPFLDVATDDVIFDYIRGGLQDGLAPARAEDAEAEMAQKDQLLFGQGRAAVIDWSLKDRYSASDVSRYREDLFIREATQGVLANQNFNYNFSGRQAADFEARVARHDALRRKKLDNRLEWLIMQAIETGGISYNDGKIKFTVNYGRPSNQTDQAPASGVWNKGTNPHFDPIGDFLDVQDKMWNLYGFRPKKVITSTANLNKVWQSDLWQAQFGMVVGGTPSTTLNPNYTAPGFGPQAAISALQAATGVEFIVYDSVWRSRPIGSTTWTNNRFLSDGKFYFLPNDGDLGEIDDTQIGFAKTLTAPHPEGNWSSGYYEWEQETKDPWGTVRGTGIKAFPVFPYMEYTYTMSI